MCGIFGVISKTTVNRKSLEILANHARQRGRDSSGLILNRGDTCHIARADYDIKTLLSEVETDVSSYVFGHSRLITNGLADNQPVIRNDVLVIHNGIIVNDEEVWKTLESERHLEIDTEVIAAISEQHVNDGKELETLGSSVVEKCNGVIAAAVIFPKLGKTVLFSNNGSLYVGSYGDELYYSSEKYPLRLIGCKDIQNIKNRTFIAEMCSSETTTVSDNRSRTENLIPTFKYIKKEADLLRYNKVQMRRCTRCILPDTMPFIHFDSNGVCNYCNNYKVRNKPRPRSELFDLVKPYRKVDQLDCIVPFSGGRDSCFGLHLIVKELKMKPITYTYDWGMVTDLGRRNISRMSSELGVENIIIAADIAKKRRNIQLNLQAWLKAPHLGMIALLTAGDKHFFRHVETVKRQTGINLNLWGVNPLEVTHFKTGFLNIAPDFEEDRVYTNGFAKQVRYHVKRAKQMFRNTDYINRSLWDTLSGEYFRSFTKKADYFHIFDYWRWDEEEVNKTLLDTYGWETATDTTTTWRIGDGTAAFYNYIYHTVAGFTEHDTFRSNQIREGDISREEALSLVGCENRPRYQNVRWYLDTLGMDFEEVINAINSMPKIYESH